MYIYKVMPYFDPNTGEPNGHQRALEQHRCDYCGKVIAYCRFRDAAQGYRAEYENRDACYGSGGTELELLRKYGMNSSVLYEAPFVFCCSANEDDMPQDRQEYERCELLMVQEWLRDALDTGEGPFAELDSIDMVWRESRVRAMRRLLESGGVKPCQIDTSIEIIEEPKDMS